MAAENIQTVAHGIADILADVGEFSSIPCLKEAATIASTLLQMLDDMQSNKKAYEEIIKEICTVVACVSMHSGEMSASLKADIEALVGHLRQIEKLCEKLLDRNRFIRFLMSARDIGDLEKMRRSIQSSFNIFYFKTAISVRFVQESERDPQLQKELLEALKAQRELMQHSLTVASLQIPEPVIVGLQHYSGNQRFEDDVNTRNVHKAGSEIKIVSPLQSFSGNQVFKAKVNTVNIVG